MRLFDYIKTLLGKEDDNKLLSSEEMALKRIENAKNKGYIFYSTKNALKYNNLRANAEYLDKDFWEYFALEEEKQSRTSIPVIDVSKEMAATIKKLQGLYKTFCNYPEILNITESDRLPMMIYIWKRWNFHGVGKEFFEIYKQYNRADLEFIAFKENKRLTAYNKSIYGVGHTEDAKTGKRTYHQPYYYDCRSCKEKNKVYNGGDIQPIEFIRICLPADLPKMFNCWRTETGHFDYYGFGIFPFETKKYKQVKQISFFINDKFVDFTPEEFKKYCEANGLKYIDGTWQGHSLKI